MISQASSQQPPRADSTTESPRNQHGEILAALRRRPGSRSDLTNRLGFSSSVISRLVQQLINQGWLVEAGIESAALGRPRTILNLNPQAGHLITVLLGPGRIQVRIVDAAGNQVISSESKLALPISVPNLLTSIDEVLQATGLTTRTLAVGFSAPGIVDRSGEVLQAPDLGWQTPVRLTEQAREHFGCVVTVDNDVNLMLLAETVTGAALEASQCAFLYHGVRGIGLGIMSNGVILPGANGASGEIGLIPLNLTAAEEPPSSLEANYSLEAIANRLTKVGITDVLDPLAALLTAAQQSADGGLLDELQLVITRAIGVITLLLDPELIIIGGGLRVVLAPRLAELHDKLSSWLPTAPKLHLSALGETELQLAVLTKCWDCLLTQTN